MLGQAASLNPSAAGALRASVGEQITNRQGGALARVGVMARGHLDCRVPELGAPGEDAVLLDNGVAEKLSQFVNFLSG